MSKSQYVTSQEEHPVDAEAKRSALSQNVVDATAGLANAGGKTLELTHRNGNERLIRRPEVEHRTGLSRSTIYDWMKRGEFPHPVKLGTRLVAWRDSDLSAWLEARVSQHD